MFQQIVIDHLKRCGKMRDINPVEELRNVRELCVVSVTARSGDDALQFASTDQSRSWFSYAGVHNRIVLFRAKCGKRPLLIAFVTWNNFDVRLHQHICILTREVKVVEMLARKVDLHLRLNLSPIRGHNKIHL